MAVLCVTLGLLGRGIDRDRGAALLALERAVDDVRGSRARALGQRAQRARRARLVADRTALGLVAAAGGDLLAAVGGALLDGAREPLDQEAHRLERVVVAGDDDVDERRIA